VNEQTLFDYLVAIWFLLAVVVFVALFFITAPYGRHLRKGWGPTIDYKIGWITMEATAAIVFATCFILGTKTSSATALVFFGLWQTHYIHRAFIYPFGQRGKDKRIPLVVVSFALLFNVVNGYLNGRYIFTFSNAYTNDWLMDVRFIVGLFIFTTGFIVNRQADRVLHSLRQPGEPGYHISYRGLYRWISCPNYFGEIAIWTGWAIATWSLPGLAFAVWTVANLAPRARSHHTWYQEYFPDYPPERRALIPKLW